MSKTEIESDSKPEIIDVTPDYDREVYCSVLELAKVAEIGKRLALECIRNSQVPVIAKVKTGKKGAPAQLYSLPACLAAVIECQENRKLLNVRRKSLAFLLGQIDEF